MSISELLVRHMCEGQMQNGSPARIASKWLKPGVMTGIALRVMCFAVLQGNSAVVAPSIQDTSLNALKVWGRIQTEAIHIGNQAFEAYDNIRFVYRVAQRLREMEREPVPAALSERIIRAPQCPTKKLVLNQHDRNIESDARVMNIVPQRL
jgi:hypothetical protein